MFRKMIGERVYCGLDIGSQRIKVGIIKVTDAKLIELLGVYETKTYGFQDASVSDLGDLSECIHQTIQQLIQKTGVKFKEVNLGFGGELVDVREISAMIPLLDRGSKVISGRDVQRVNKQARSLGMKIEEEVLHDLPQCYKVDDADSAINPVGLYGRKLGVQSLMIYANMNRIRNITKAVHQAGYDVMNIFFSSYASSEVILNENEKKDGSLLIDIGSKSTCLLFFSDGKLKHFRKILLGGQDVTRSLSKALNLPFDLAEDIKKSYAVAHPSHQNHNEEILVKRESSYVPISKEHIFRAIEPDIDKLVKGINEDIRGSGLFDQINQGIIMIGGGSLLSGLIERIGEETNFQSRLGEISIDSKKNFGNAAIFSSVIGLAQNGMQKSFGYSFSSNGHAHWGKYMTSKLRELYQEYF